MSVDLLFKRSASLGQPVHLVFGGADSINYVSPNGLTGAFGQPTTLNASPAVQPNGINSFVSGTALAENRNRYYYPAGASYFLDGTATAYNKTSIVGPAGLTDTFGTTSVRNQHTWLLPTGFSLYAGGTTAILGMRRHVGAQGIPPQTGNDYEFNEVSHKSRTVSPAPVASFYSVLHRILRGEEYTPEGTWTIGARTAQKSSIFGTAAVSLLNRQVAPQGLTAPAIGGGQATNFIRYVEPAAIIGQGGEHHVHRWPTISPQGIGGSIGIARVERLVRTIRVDSSAGPKTGWGFWMGEANSFSPMTVRIKLIAQPTGVTGSLGSPSVATRSRTVYPASMVSLFGTPAMGGRTTLTAVGLNSLAMGVPARPVYGTVIPAGPDLAAFGRAGLNLGAHPAYIEPGVVPTPKARRGVRPLGMDTLFGNSVVIGESNCGSKLAVIPMLGDLTRFGSAGVT